MVLENSIWNFISSVYQANWDLFYTDNKTMTLRAKISSKFTPRIPLPTNKNNKETVKFTNGGLSFSLFHVLFSFYFHFIFLFFYF